MQDAFIIALLALVGYNFMFYVVKLFFNNAKTDREDQLLGSSWILMWVFFVGHSPMMMLLMFAIALTIYNFVKRLRKINTPVS